MRAPDDIKKRLGAIPEWSEFSRIAQACVRAGKEPTSGPVMRAERKRLDKRIASLFRRGDVSAEALRLVAAYLKGEVDRTRQQGRPFDPWRVVVPAAEEWAVRETQRKRRCSLRRAIELTAPQLKLDDAGCQRLWKRLTR